MARFDLSNLLTVHALPSTASMEFSVKSTPWPYRAPEAPFGTASCKDRDDRATWTAPTLVRSRQHSGPHPVAYPTVPAQPSQQQRPFNEAVRAALGRLIARDVTVREPRVIKPPGRIQTIYSLELADGQELVLIMAPSAMVRLLRSEQLLVESEATVVGWIKETLNRDRLAVSRILNLADGHTMQDSLGGTAGGAQRLFEAAMSSPPSSYMPFQLELLQVLPSLLTSSLPHASQNLEEGLESPYAIYRQTGNIFTHLNQQDGPSIDFQAGLLVRQLSQLTAPSGKFGPAIPVIAPPFTSTTTTTTTTTSTASDTTPSFGVKYESACPEEQTKLSGGNASRIWSAAFHSMMEGVMRDAEDMAINIPYGTIRRHLRRLGFLLDSVKTPRLVLVDAAEKSNIMIKRRTVAPEVAVTSRAGHGYGGGFETEVKITGLSDWSNAFFGDPLYTRAFSENPSADFLRGFYGPEGDVDLDRGVAHQQTVEEDAAGVRILLYSCYHLAVSIVREYYRPRQGSTEREMEARRKLGDVLAKLALVDVTEGLDKRGRRPSLANLASESKRKKVLSQV